MLGGLSERDRRERDPSRGAGRAGLQLPAGRVALSGRVRPSPTAMVNGLHDPDGCERD